MADKLDDKQFVFEDSPAEVGTSVAVGIDEAAAIPKGTIDPVYEAKARVLNRAIQDIGMGELVRCVFCPLPN